MTVISTKLPESLTLPEPTAVGSGKVSDSGSLVEMTVKKGDKVLYGKYSGSEVTFDGVEYVIMRESDILAVL